MNNRKELAAMLCQVADQCGLVEAMGNAFGNDVKVSIPFSHMAAELPITEMDFSVRATNCLHRAGRKTVGDIVDVINSDELGGYRNIGRKTVSEIKTKLLVYGYYCLNAKEKERFWLELIERNCIA